MSNLGGARLEPGGHGAGRHAVQRSRGGGGQGGEVAAVGGAPAQERRQLVQLVQQRAAHAGVAHQLRDHPAAVAYAPACRRLLIALYVSYTLYPTPSAKGGEGILMI